MAKLKVLSAPSSQDSDIIVVSDNSSYVGIATQDSVDLVLSASSLSSAIQVTVTDSSAGGGNNRGNGSVDLQRFRNSASAVASGLRSALLGGADNTASGIDSGVFAGDSNTVTNQDCAIVAGNGNVVGGLNGRSGIFAGFNNEIAQGASLAGNFGIMGGRRCDGDSLGGAIIGAYYGHVTGSESGDGHYAVVLGGVSARADHPGSVAFSGNSETPGDTQRGKSQGQFVHLDQRTTNNTPATMDSIGTELSVPDNTAFGVFGKVICWNETDETLTTWDINFDCYSPDGSSITFLAGNGAQTIASSNDGGTPALSIGATSNTINFDITGLTSKNLRWSANLNIARAAT